MPTATIKTRQVYHFSVMFAKILLIILNYIIGNYPIIVFVNINSQNSTNLEILRNVLFGIQLHKIQYYSYFEEILST